MEKGLPSEAEFQETQTPHMPPLRTFVVRRAKWDDGSLEEIVVDAHINHTGEAGVLSFTEFVIDPLLGPTSRVRRAFREWFDMEEIVIVTPPSMIIH